MSQFPRPEMQEIGKSADEPELVTFTGRMNNVRHRIPFAYWLVYDAVLAPFLIWGMTVSMWFAVPLAMLAFATCFDVNEAVVKWAMRR